MTLLSTQLLVIGGGATGLGIAWDAALRGLKVVLVEQYDLAQGTSGRYHGLLHSGGRYVISDPVSAVDCARENEILRKIAPQTIEDTGGLFIATPADPIDYPDRWFNACAELGIPAAEVKLSEIQVREPLLNPRISRAFEVRDASLDSFDLSHALHDGIVGVGGRVLLRHRTEEIFVKGDRATGALIHDLSSGERFRLDTEVIVNAAGPWSREVGRLAGFDIPITLGKGSMIAMASRLVNTVINRLKPPSDGDIAVPIGTVCVLGTTDVPVDSPLSLQIEPWEVDLLIAEGDFMIPGLQSARPLRAWSGVRPLFDPGNSSSHYREISRAHAILDHKELNGVDGLLSVIGGKLTTFRLMAEEAVDLACNKLEQSLECVTERTPLGISTDCSYFQITDRVQSLVDTQDRSGAEDLLCECELVTRGQLEKALRKPGSPKLDDLRRDFRLGMGPCQGAFCAYRAAGIAAQINPALLNAGYLQDFVNERWKGLRPVAWGENLRQMDFFRRTHIELLGLQASDNS